MGVLLIDEGYMENRWMNSGQMDEYMMDGWIMNRKMNDGKNGRMEAWYMGG